MNGVRAALVVAFVACQGVPSIPRARAELPVVQPNDNRQPAGRLYDGVLTIHLDAMVAGWRPDPDVDSLVTMQVFAERGKPPQIPGPLIRVPEGTEVRAVVRNLIPDSAVVVHGLTGGTGRGDSVRIAPGATRELRFRTTRPGTFLYHGRTMPFPSVNFIVNRRDGGLKGALIVDPRGHRPDIRERIFVINLVDLNPDSAKGERDNVWEIAVNGLSWPHTERLSARIGDTVRWRWINGTDRPHPMHLHGFHFRVLSKGLDGVDTLYTPEQKRFAVTEFFTARATFVMEWVPARPGNWLMHCHMIPHIVPFPTRADTVRAHDVHRVREHPEQSMAGLVMAVHVTGRRRRDPALSRGGAHHRLLIQQWHPAPTQSIRRSYIVQRGPEPSPDSVQIPGSLIVATRGRTSTVAIVNRLSEPTTVHWHGMELNGIFDGVPGFSGSGRNRTPLIAPGDSFTVSFTPPRAGTYMYHTHMDEEDQLEAGLYAPIIVLEPGERYDPATDIPLVIGFGHDETGQRVRAVNGRGQPPPIHVRAGVRHRLRIINLMSANPTRIRMRVGDSVTTWVPISKDGANLPEALRVERRAVIEPIGVGEAYDFEWIPGAGPDAVMTFEVTGPAGRIIATTTQRFVVATR